MNWNTIYRTGSMQDESKEVVRVHDIGDATNVRMEMGLGTLNFNDRKILAIVSDDHAREVAEFLSQKTGLPLEL